MSGSRSTKKPRVILADDHSMMAAGVRELLQVRYEVAEIVEDGRRLLEAAERLRPDVLLVDISMPGLDGVEATRLLRRRLPETPVVILTMHQEARHVKAALDAGASGYLVKSSAPGELFEALDEVLAGRRYITAALGGKVLGEVFSSESGTATEKAPLSAREFEVAQLVAQGLETAEIAEHLHIAEVTVRTHIRRSLEKLELKNRIELVRFVLENAN